MIVCWITEHSQLHSLLHRQGEPVLCGAWIERRLRDSGAQRSRAPRAAGYAAGCAASCAAGCWAGCATVCAAGAAGSRRRRISLSFITKMMVKEENEKIEKNKTLRYCVIHYCVVQPTCSYITLTLQNKQRPHNFVKTRQMGILRQRKNVQVRSEAYENLKLDTYEWRQSIEVGDG